MSDLDQRVTAGLRTLADRAPIDADVWPAAERYVAEHRRHRRAVAGTIAVTVVLAAALSTAVAVRGAGSRGTVANPGPRETTTLPGPDGSVLPADGPVDGAFTITATPRIAFEPSSITVPTGVYAVTFVDGAAAAHTLHFDDSATMLAPLQVSADGERKTARIFFGRPGDYSFACMIPGHRVAGEHGVVHVTGPEMTLAEAEARATRLSR